MLCYAATSRSRCARSWASPPLTIINMSMMMVIIANITKQYVLLLTTSNVICILLFALVCNN